MSLFGSAIVALCMGASGNVNRACVSAIDAGTRQAGIRQSADMAEEDFVYRANAKAERELSRTQMQALGVAGFALRAAKDQKVAFRLPTLGVCNSLTNEITPSSYFIFMKWDF